MSRPGTTALVTGASRGIGKSIAQQLSARGVRVAVHYNVNKEAAEAVLASLEGTGHIALSANIADAKAVERMWAEAISAFGRVDIVINCAGICSNHPPLSTSYESWQAEWDSIMATNLHGPANLCHLAANSMTSTPVPPTSAAAAAASSSSSSSFSAFGRGRIVNVSSRGAFRGEPTAPAYGASKAGLNSMSQSLALALAPHAVYVYVVAPGWVDTEMAKDALSGPGGAAVLAQHPLGRVATPEEVAQTCVFCALDAPAAMTGCVIDINGASYLRT
jgi:NAD(P)-dependent dehydrogenase (short-subunit alcohol dehydrogenase family)